MSRRDLIPTADRLFVYRLVTAGFIEGRSIVDIADSICDGLAVDRHWTPARPMELRGEDDRLLWEDALDRRRDGSAL